MSDYVGDEGSPRVDESVQALGLLPFALFSGIAALNGYLCLTVERSPVRPPTASVWWPASFSRCSALDRADGPAGRGRRAPWIAMGGE